MSLLKKSNKAENAEHICYKNWDGTSCAMEPDILVNAFNQSKKIHGLEYRCFIGDGDSSVHKKLREMVSYGKHIEKIECANHAIKNYNKALSRQQGVSKAIRKSLTRPVIQRLVKAARAAIIHNSKNGKDSTCLREELRNGPLHVFGNHKHCKTYFCTEIGNGTALNPDQSDALNYAKECVKPLVRKAHQLVIMSLVAKFSGGKQVNRCKRGSYELRCKGAALDYQFGPWWHYQAIKKAVGQSPCNIVKKLAHRRHKKLSATRRSLLLQGNLEEKKLQSPRKIRKTTEKHVRNWIWILMNMMLRLLILKML